MRWLAATHPHIAYYVIAIPVVVVTIAAMLFAVPGGFPHGVLGDVLGLLIGGVEGWLIGRWCFA